MNRVLAWFLKLLLFSFLILGAYNLFQRLELVESIEKIKLKGEARTNPLYAARIFLHRIGIPASTKQSLQGLKTLPDTDTLLLISSKRFTLSKENIDNLYAWVQSGGQLITRMIVDTSPFDYFSEDDDAVIEARDEETPSNDPLQALLGVKTGNWTSFYSETTGAKIHLKGTKKAFVTRINSFYPIESANGFSSINDETIKINDKVFMLRRKIGKGMITLVAELDFIDNRNIRKADHAEILWHLVHDFATPKKVWLIHNNEVPALWRLLWKYAWALIITLTLLFILWLYRAVHRFGPLIPKAAEDRRSLLEHIHASGNFYWKHQQKAKLIASTREALNQRLALTHPGWAQLSNTEKITQLAIRLDRPREEIQQLLFDPNYGLNKHKSDEFTQLVKQLEQVRTAL